MLTYGTEVTLDRFWAKAKSRDIDRVLPGAVPGRTKAFMRLTTETHASNILSMRIVMKVRHLRIDVP